MQTEITFSFGKNWKDYAQTIGPDAILKASEGMNEFLPAEIIKGKRVLDIGSGSGIHSLVFYQQGAKEIFSFDYDPYSVETTRQLWEQSQGPDHWQITQGSILEQDFIRSLEQFDIVYTWGVLHHTGAMWQAVDNALSLVAPQGYLFMSLYTKGPLYPQHLALKQRYNRASWLEKRYMEYALYILPTMKARLKQRKNPFTWNERKERGMNIYHDIIDWLGGLPYEVASPAETISTCEKAGFELKKLLERGEGGCSEYLFQRKA